MDIFLNKKSLLLVGALLAGIVPLAIAQNPDKASVKPEVLEKLRQHGVEKILFVTRASVLVAMLSKGKVKLADPQKSEIQGPSAVPDLSDI